MNWLDRFLIARTIRRAPAITEKMIRAQSPARIYIDVYAITPPPPPPPPGGSQMKVVNWRTAKQTISNTAETWLLNYTIPAGDMDAPGKGFAFDLAGSTVISGAIYGVIRFRVYLGGVGLFDVSTPGGITLTTLAWRLQGCVLASGASAQFGSLQIVFNNNVVAPVVVFATGAIAMATPKDLLVTLTQNYGTPDVITTVYDGVIIQLA